MGGGGEGWEVMEGEGGRGREWSYYGFIPLDPLNVEIHFYFEKKNKTKTQSLQIFFVFL